MKVRLIGLCALALVGFAGAAQATQETSRPTAAEGTAQVAPQAEAAPAEPAAPALPRGARVQLEVVDALTSASAVEGQEIALRLVEPIAVDGVVIVPAGTPAMGVILHVQESGIGGRPGTIAAAARHLDINGERIGIEGMIVGGAGQNNSLVSSAGGLVGAFIQGSDFQVAAGTRVSARIAGGPPEVAAPVEGRNPVPAPPPGRAIVIFYQLAQMGTEFYTYGAAENGVTLARLRGNQYFVVEVDPGLHEFEVLASMGGRRTGITLRQEIFEGQMIFIRHDRSFLSPGDGENFERRRLRMAPSPTAE